MSNGNNHLTGPKEREWEFLYVSSKLIEMQAALALHYTVLTATSAYWSQVFTFQGSIVTDQTMTSELCKTEIRTMQREDTVLIYINFSYHEAMQSKDYLNNRIY